MNKRGFFICFEGIDGSGKSQAMEVLYQRLRDVGILAHQTREPGGTPLAEAVREIVTRHWREPVDDLTELLLIFAARRQHILNFIEPHLARGEWVLCDRFSASSFAYQGGGRGLDHRLISRLNDWTLEGLVPDLTFLFDLPAEVARQRINERVCDRIEIQPLEFFEQVREEYLNIAQREEAHYQVLDATINQQKLADVAWHELQKLVRLQSV